MQLRSTSRTYFVYALSLLCTCIGCGESSKSDAPARNVAPTENAPSASSDADVGSGQLVKMGVEKLDAKQYDEAIELFSKAAENNPSASIHAIIGDCYWQQQKLDQADNHYRRALELDPKHCGANHALGRDAVLLKRYQDAIPYLDTASEVCAGTVLHAKNLRFRVEAFLELDRITEAESDLEKLVAKYPEDANTYEAGLLVARKKGDESLAADYEAKLKSKSTGEPN